jgi:hypothetical protein
MEEKPTSKQNPLELKERAVRMVREIRQQDPSDKEVISRVARSSARVTSHCGRGSSRPTSTPALGPVSARPSSPS